MQYNVHLAYTQKQLGEKNAYATKIWTNNQPKAWQQMQ